MRDDGFYGEPMNITDQLKYKYQIVPDGNMAPSSRMVATMYTGSVIFKQDSPSVEVCGMG